MSTPHLHLEPAEIACLLQEFRLKPLHVQHIRKVYKVATPDGCFALKPTHLTREELEFIQSVLLHLTKEGFPALPFRPTFTGELFMSVGDTRFLVMPWFDGGEANFDRLNNLDIGAKILALLHRTSEGFGLSSAPKARVYWGRWPKIWGRRLNQLEYFKALSGLRREPFDRIYTRHVPYFLNQARRAITALNASPYHWIVAEEKKKGYLCHHDFSARNLLLAPTGCCLVDFDYCLCDLRLHDLANLMLRLLRHDKWQYTRARFALLVYHRQYPLSGGHLQVLHALLEWPQDFWQVGLQYYVERLAWPTPRFLKSLKKKIQEEVYRQNFLARFPQENGISRFVPADSLLQQIPDNISFSVH